MSTASITTLAALALAASTASATPTGQPPGDYCNMIGDYAYLVASHRDDGLEYRAARSSTIRTNQEASGDAQLLADLLRTVDLAYLEPVLGPEDEANVATLYCLTLYADIEVL